MINHVINSFLCVVVAMTEAIAGCAFPISCDVEYSFTDEETKVVWLDVKSAIAACLRVRRKLAASLWTKFSLQFSDWIAQGGLRKRGHFFKAPGETRPMMKLEQAVVVLCWCRSEMRQSAMCADCVRKLPLPSAETAPMADNFHVVLFVAFDNIGTAVLFHRFATNKKLWTILAR